MSKGVNKVILVGLAGKDPEIRVSQSGVTFANLSIATTEKWKDKNTGEQREATEWHRLVFAGRLAEIVGEYVRKGSQIYVEGKLATRKWTDSSGIEKYTTEIKCHEMHMLGSKQQVQQQQAPQQQSPQQPSYAQAPQAAQRPYNERPMPPQQAPVNTGGPDDFDNDLPF